MNLKIKNYLNGLTMTRANPNYIYLKKNVPKNRITLLQGSTRSGKTYSIIYYLIYLCENYSGLEIDIVRDTNVAVKATVWKDFKDILNEIGLYSPENHYKSDQIYELNGNFINYYGADSGGKIHGRSRDILWVNEAHQFPKETIDQLFPRTRFRIICDYNPALGDEHWLDVYIEKYNPFITTYKDNPYLTAAQILEIESRKNDPYWWAIYGTGQRAARQGVIFTNWEIGQFDESLPYGYGMDFGFSIDPTVLVRVAVDNSKKVIYINEEYYSNTQLSTSDIKSIIGSRIKRKDDLIVADRAEGRLIYELSSWFNIIPCTKGADSVREGIATMLDYKLIVTENSRNIIKELNNYCWNDKKSGVPIDAYNHAIDSVRYIFKKLITGKSFIDFL